MGRVIVDNRSNLPDMDAVQRVAHHMAEDSQVEGRPYLAAALYMDDIVITHTENKASHRFVVSGSFQKQGNVNE